MFKLDQLSEGCRKLTLTCRSHHGQTLRDSRRPSAGSYEGADKVALGRQPQFIPQFATATIEAVHQVRSTLTQQRFFVHFRQALPDKKTFRASHRVTTNFDEYRAKGLQNLRFRGPNRQHSGHNLAHKVLQAQRDSSVLNALQVLQADVLTARSSWNSQVDKLDYVHKLAVEHSVHAYASARQNPGSVFHQGVKAP